jgi:hypothetical protein
MSEIGIDTIKLNEIEYVRKDAVQALQVNPGESLYQVGRSVVIRTVTYHYIGRITFVSDTELVLDEASWLAISKRYNTTLKTGEVDELEPFIDPVSLNRGAIVDGTLWRHPLPREAK